MIKQICSAIELNKVIKFYYNGGIRLVEPFCCGIHKTTGSKVLRGYQIGGYSESGEIEGWKLFLIDDMSALIITDNIFNISRPNYNPIDKAMSTIYSSA
jgi:hypothetical protein